MFYIVDTDYNIIEEFTTMIEALEELCYLNDEYCVMTEEELTGEIG